MCHRRRRSLNVNELRAQFSAALSERYRAEVPQYGVLLDVVDEVHRARDDGEAERLRGERHGAIRLGTPQELSLLRRLFALFGMHPVGYYDLSAADIPVHSTAFRPIDSAALAAQPFRMFVSLLRLDLIPEPLRSRAQSLLDDRAAVFAPLRAAIECAEADGLNDAVADALLRAALELFAFRPELAVGAATYRDLRDVHPVIADIVAFRGPHVNHLTPRTIDIEAVQRSMSARGLRAKASIEGPPARVCPVLLRQTSFLAVEETIMFHEPNGARASGVHAARFGEVEQRGVALRRAGRERYDRALARHDEGAFAELPDTLEELRAAGLAYVRYRRADGVATLQMQQSVDALVSAGGLVYEPITYEDFLPVSAAGIFRSNLGYQVQSAADGSGTRGYFEAQLEAALLDEHDLYEAEERGSLDACFHGVGRQRPENRAYDAPFAERMLSSMGEVPGDRSRCG